MTKALSPSARRVREALAGLGFGNEIRELPDTTRTAADAARALGCQVGQIAKSLVFRGQTSGQPVLVIASGSNRVDEKLLARVVGEEVEKADADFVRARTGFVIGGVPPVGHATPLEIFVDQDLWQHAEIWAAAGNPHAVFKLTPDEAQRMTGGMVIAIT